MNRQEKSEVEIKEIDGWEIVGEIARGASSIIYEAKDAKGRRAALKILDRETLLEYCRAGVNKSDVSTHGLDRKAEDLYDRQIRAFKSEYQSLIGLAHKNVAKAYQFGYHKDSFFICSEYIEGQPLAKMFRGKNHIDMVPFFIQLLEGLDFIHRNGLLHMDIKNSNVLVDTSKGDPVVKIIDFGISIPPEEYEGAFTGSPSYMAPEVAFGLKEKVGVRSDLFSAGVLFYFCLAWGHHPFLRTMAEGDYKKIREIIAKEKPPRPPSSGFGYRGGFPEFLDTITMRLIAKEPEDRFYGNARAVINALLTHSPDAFAGRGGHYLLPPHGEYVGQATVIKDIVHQLGGHQSSAYEIIGKDHFGKSYLLQCVKQQVELRSDQWFPVSLSLPASGTEVESWLNQLQLMLAEGERGVVALVDNIDDMDLCTKEVREEVENVICNLAQSIDERNKTPALFEGMRPILLVLTSRPSPPLDDASEQTLPLTWGERVWTSVKQIHLHPFTKEELRQYLKLTPTFRERDLPEKWVEELYSRTNGIPKEVSECLKDLDQKGILFSLDGELMVTPSPLVGEGGGEGATTPPPSTKERLLGEYRSLNPTEKAIVDLMAVWGWKGLTRPITFKDISNFIYTPSLRQNIENLIQIPLLCKPACPVGREGKGEVEETYHFLNSYFPTLIYEQIPPEDCEAMHDAIAHYLKTDQDAILLHKGYGGDSKESVKCLGELGRTLLEKRGKAGLATELLSTARGRSTVSQPEVNSLLLTAIFFEGDYLSLTEMYERILKEVSIKNGQNWKLHYDITWVQALLRTKRYDEAKVLIDESKKLCHDLGFDAFLTIFENYEARSFYEESFVNTNAASELLEKSLARYAKTFQKAKGLAKEEIRVVVSNDIGVVLRSMGRYEEAKKYLMEKLKLLQDAGLIFSSMEALTTLADTCRFLKDYDAAEHFVLQAMNMAKAADNTRWLIYSHESLIDIYHSRRKYEEALAVASRCVALSAVLPVTQEYKYITHRLWGKMGHCYKEMKECDRATQFFEAVIGQDPADVYSMSAYVGLGEVYYYKKDYKNSLIYLDKAEKLLGQFPEKSHAERIQELKKLI